MAETEMYLLLHYCIYYSINVVNQKKLNKMVRVSRITTENRPDPHIVITNFIKQSFKQ